jgi:hypothetical protein
MCLLLYMWATPTERYSPALEGVMIIQVLNQPPDVGNKRLMNEVSSRPFISIDARGPQ